MPVVFQVMKSKGHIYSISSFFLEKRREQCVKMCAFWAGISSIFRTDFFCTGYLAGNRIERSCIIKRIKINL